MEASFVQLVLLDSLVGPDNHYADGLGIPDDYVKHCHFDDSDILALVLVVAS